VVGQRRIPRLLRPKCGSALFMLAFVCAFAVIACHHRPVGATIPQSVTAPPPPPQAIASNEAELPLLPGRLPTPSLPPPLMGWHRWSMNDLVEGTILPGSLGPFMTLQPMQPRVDIIRRIPHGVVVSEGFGNGVTISVGNVAFKSQDTMVLGETYPVLVLVSAVVTKEELERTLDQQLQKAWPPDQRPPDQGKITSEGIKVAPLMRAHLSANTDEFEISPATPEDQDTTAEPVTKWEWTVKPLKPGKGLKLDLTISIVLDTQGVPHALETLHRFITVTVSLPERVAAFVDNNWQWLWAALLVPVAGWLWKKRKKPADEAASYTPHGSRALRRRGKNLPESPDRKSFSSRLK
jgi:hypothetical protein